MGDDGAMFLVQLGALRAAKRQMDGYAQELDEARGAAAYTDGANSFLSGITIDGWDMPIDMAFGALCQPVGLLVHGAADLTPEAVGVAAQTMSDLATKLQECVAHYEEIEHRNTQGFAAVRPEQTVPNARGADR